MRLLVGGLLAASLAQPVVAQQTDSTFKNVEYLSGISTMPKKQKGTLIVSTTELKLVDKKGSPYLTIPIATIGEVTDTTLGKSNGKKSTMSTGASGGGNAVSAVSGLFKKKPETQIIVSAKRDSASAAEEVVFKIHEEEDSRNIASVIRARVKGEPLTPPSPNAAAAEEPVAPSLIMLVANPFTEVAADSAAAVQIGTALREEVTKFAGDKFIIVTREQMNKALEPYGYPADAILSPTLASTLAAQINAAVLISGTMKKDRATGRYAVSASLAQVGGSPGTPVTVTQNADESLDAFGRRVAEALKGPPPSPTPD